MTSLFLTGRSEEFLVNVGGNTLKIHREILTQWQAMVKSAAQEGFELKIISAYRSFSAQLGIWNAKIEGKRPILDFKSQPIDPKSLTDKEKVYAILRWSALPGASRHHWGTDIDIFDGKAMTEGYKIQLIPSEYEGSGIFSGVSSWLDKNLAGFGFFRPYETDRGGVSPERWHLSFGPVAENFQKHLTVPVLRTLIEESPLLLKEVVLAELENIHHRFIMSTDPWSQAQG